MIEYKQILLPRPDLAHQVEVTMLSENMYSLGGKAIELFGRIHMPIQGRNFPFSVGIWLHIAMNDFLAMKNQFQTVMKCGGKLIQDVPFFMTGMDTEVKCFFDTSVPTFHEPNIEVVDNEILKKHQVEGIPLQMYLEWMEKLSAQ